MPGIKHHHYKSEVFLLLGKISEGTRLFIIVIMQVNHNGFLELEALMSVPMYLLPPCKSNVEAEECNPLCH